MAIPRPAASGVLDHPSWCDPAECTAAGPSEFHPVSPPPAHRGRRHTCNPDPGPNVTETAVQLVRFVEDPQPHDFVRLELGDSDGRQSYYVRFRQAEGMTDALTTILGQARGGWAGTGISTGPAGDHARGHEPGA